MHRLVDESSDETRSLRMEYFLISAEDNFSESYKPKDNDSAELTFYARFIQKEKLEELDESVKKFFEYFCNEVFLGNGRILYDGIEKSLNENKDICKSSEEHKPNEMFSDDYFVERWKMFRKLDNDWGKIEKSADMQEQFHAELELYKLLNNEVDLSSDDESSIIEKRYCELLTRIQNIITKKYGIERENIHIALLTSSERKDGNNEIGLQNLEMVQNLIAYEDGVSSEEKGILDSNTKFIIKKRLISMLKDSDFKELGYKIINFDDSQESNTFRQPNINQSYESINKTNYGKPYFILKFQNNSIVNDLDSSKMIIPVYLYLSVLVEEDSHIEKTILPQLIMRDILTYRNKIINYLEEDFTNDVMQRYSNSMATEAILKNERVMSHTPMEQDKKELEILLLEPSGHYLTGEIDRIKGWSIARNYCNTMIARLYNRVFRNIDKSFQKIISEYKYINRETYKLYIQSNGSDNDGKNIPLTNLNQIIPYNNNVENDVIYRLFNDIIDFKCDPALKNFLAYCYTFEKNNYAYNLDYVKSIIYRICFDAMRFSFGAGSEKDDFVSRVANHYRAKTRWKIKKEKPNNKWLSCSMPNICNMKFSFEVSNSENFDWLVIKNEIYKPFENKIEFLKKKMEDPLDFTDGHMSLITAKEYFAKMLDEKDQNLLENMYNYIDEDNTTYFITKLPIIKKGEIANENNLDR